MILDQKAYERLRAAEERLDLSATSPGESLAIGEALWTSKFASTIEVAPEPRGENLARRLSIPPDRLAAAWAIFRK